MTHRHLVTTLALISTLLATGSLAEAQGRQRDRDDNRRRPVPRSSAPAYRVPPRPVRPDIVVVQPFRYYSPRTRAGLYYGYPREYARGYGYGRAYPAPGYFAPVPGERYGGIRIDLPQRHAEVFVGGYFVGHVDDFDGVFQQLNLEPGPHRIEIHAPDHEPIVFDVRVEPGRTITYRASMRPFYR